MCEQLSCTNPYWICGYLKLVKIQPNSLVNFVDNFLHESLLNLWASKASQNSTEFLSEICGQFSCMNPYWICAHLKLVKIRHESLLNLWASKSTPNLTEFLTENCAQISSMNPYWICAHLKLLKILHEPLLKCVHIFSAWIFTEFVRI